MKFALITGASKGLGAEIAKRMLAENIGIITISRTENTELQAIATEKGHLYQHISCSLSDVEQAPAAFSEAATMLFGKRPELVYLINNAGAIEPIETVGRLDAQFVEDSIQINLTAPVLLTNLFIAEANRHNTPIHIINISSGAGERPIQGWSIYCSTKAALNMFTQTAALEQRSAGHPHKIIAFSPGVMDTEMQVTIRSSSAEAFHDVDTFQQYKETGALRSPYIVANALMDKLLEGTIDSGKIYHINELL
ncbi:(S)-benzoin forming benzil reductase [Bacillus canaveralius]|uniref:(S)-benzoin forming benzil reductase n=1 Tax=Bacillus canaveralius TaxID=1403243 RepID=UPI000F7B93B1|nr:(S)-benzoin forming benzil reductase [Bacillus canaveralius]RSK55506.1 (S)-benzoin forming benzil reductase [Bacillus canaveralius]